MSLFQQLQYSAANLYQTYIAGPPPVNPAPFADQFTNKYVAHGGCGHVKGKTYRKQKQKQQHRKKKISRTTTERRRR